MSGNHLLRFFKLMIGYLGIFCNQFLVTFFKRNNFQRFILGVPKMCRNVVGMLSKRKWYYLFHSVLILTKL
jgi:hypothetical protein